MSGYDPEEVSRKFKLVSAVVDWDHTHTEQVYMLTINQVIYIPHIKNHLLCPMQCIVNSVIINELPNFLSDNPFEANHAIQVTDLLDDNSTLIIPLHLHVIITYFSIRKPMIKEYDKKEKYC